MKTYIQTAKEMLGGRPLTSGLRRRLIKINALCERAGGELVSRQAIAMVLVDWALVHQPNKKE